MRSEATIRRSPSTSYISRTLPVEWSFRSASVVVVTGAMLTIVPASGGGGGDGRNRTRHPPLEGSSSEDPGRGQLVLRRAGGDAHRSAGTGRGNRVVRNESRPSSRWAPGLVSSHHSPSGLVRVKDQA